MKIDLPGLAAGARLSGYGRMDCDPVLATAGLYEHSDQWLYDIGLPGKAPSSSRS